MSDLTVETIVLKDGRELRILTDDCAPSPRAEFKCLGEIIHWHTKYALGRQVRRPADLPPDTEDAIWLPVYLFDHSGLELSTKPFSCSWDSGQVGIIRHVLTKDTKDMDPEVIRSALAAEVSQYSDFLSGSVYRYELGRYNFCATCKHTEWVVEDECSGFYGEEGLGQIKELIKPFLAEKEAEHEGQ